MNKMVTKALTLLGLSKDTKKSLFDGDNSLFKSLLAQTSVYGEYGCGESTKWVLQNRDIPVFSVDTSKQWIDHVLNACEGAILNRAHIQHIDLGILGKWGRPVSYTKRDHFVQYTNWIWEQDKKPDTVLIDGRFRVCCFLTSLKFADEGTKLIFDDYVNRPRYHIVEKFVNRKDICGRQCLFIVPERSQIDEEALKREIHNFRHVMD